MADDAKQLEELETLEAFFAVGRELIYNRRPKKIPLWQEHDEEENGITNDEPDRSSFTLRLVSSYDQSDAGTKCILAS